MLWRIWYFKIRGYCLWVQEGDSSLILWLPPLYHKKDTDLGLVSKSSQTLSRFRVQGTLLALTTSELLLLYYLLRRCHLAIQFHLHCENLSATHLAANPVFHARSKHIYISLQPLPSPFPVSLSRLTHRSVRSFIALLAHYPRRAPPLSFKWELFL